MKLWELESVCRSEPHLMERLGGRPEWSTYLAWHRDFDAIVRDQDRAKLDAELPDEACVHVLSGSGVRYYLGEGYVRLRRQRDGDEELTAVDVFRRFGGAFLEDVTEAGLARVVPQ